MSCNFVVGMCRIKDLCAIIWVDSISLGCDNFLSICVFIWCIFSFWVFGYKYADGPLFYFWPIQVVDSFRFAYPIYNLSFGIALIISSIHFIYALLSLLFIFLSIQAVTICSIVMWVFMFCLLSVWSVWLTWLKFSSVLFLGCIFIVL
jgi:hypothetical protein